MSAKYFCDQCGVELTNRNRANPDGDRMAAEIGHLKATVLVSQNGVANAGDYCKYCVLDALYKLDDRPKQETRQ